MEHIVSRRVAVDSLRCHGDDKCVRIFGKGWSGWEDFHYCYKLVEDNAPKKKELQAFFDDYIQPGNLDGLKEYLNKKYSSKK